MGLISVADKLNYIAISVPAVDDETFYTITGTHNMEKVLALPSEIHNCYGSNSPVLGSRIVLTNKNYRSIKKFLDVIREKEFDYALFKVVRDYEDNGQGLGQAEEAFLKEEIKKIQGIDQKFTNLKTIFDYRNLPEFKNNCWVNLYGMIANVSMDGNVYPNIVEINQEDFCIGNLYEQTLEEMWNSSRHEKVKEYSKQKWLSGQCRNCRAMSYNQIYNQMVKLMPDTYDPFI